jgi:hypothetical protein
MIDQVYIRNQNRAVIGIIDAAESIIWEQQYYDTGNFEVYCHASSINQQLLQLGNYVTRTDNENIGIIESVEIKFEVENGLMITASGRFAKSILDRRLIYNISGHTIYPIVFSGNLETAVRNLVSSNIINATDSSRNINFIELGTVAGITDIITSNTGESADKQTSYANLLSYTDNLLREYHHGAKMILDESTKKLQYAVYTGMNRSNGNTDGNNPIVFSQDFDNLISSDYQISNMEWKNAALIGGQGEGTERFCVLMVDSTQTGINRREVFIDSSSQSKTYKNNSDQEVEYTDSEYTQLLITDAMQKISEFKEIESFSGEIDITNSIYKFNRDFYLGDLVTIQDNQIGVYQTVRIIKATEVQDDNGYILSVEFGE